MVADVCYIQPLSEFSVHVCCPRARGPTETHPVTPPPLDRARMRNPAKYKSFSRGRSTDRGTKHDQYEGLEWFQWVVPVFGVAAATAIAIHTRLLKNRKGPVRVNNMEGEGSKALKQIHLSHVQKRCALVKSKSAFVTKVHTLKRMKVSKPLKPSISLWRLFCHLVGRIDYW